MNLIFTISNKNESNNTEQDTPRVQNNYRLPLRNISAKNVFNLKIPEQTYQISHQSYTAVKNTTGSTRNATRSKTNVPTSELVDFGISGYVKLD